MTVCEVCGGDQFTLEDGYYFCDECHTQSQDMREMVTDDIIAQGVREVRSAVVSEKTLADRRRSKERQAEIRGVRTCLDRTEALNILLRRWTAALVARGAPAELPEVTVRLWERLLRAERSRGSLTIGSLTAILWMALTECEPLCRLSDLLRWARQGVVPVYSASNELPEDVTATWVSIGLQRRLCVSKMLNRCATLARKLNVAPPVPPLRPLLRRLLSELMLPARLADVVANVARRAPPPHRFVPEADALALLLLTLKILLGLDDATEIRNSEVAAARNTSQPDGPRWFVFTEWLEFIRQQSFAAGEQDFLELETHSRDLETLGEPDLCRRRHRQLLFDYFRREGTFRCIIESSYRVGCHKPEYKMQTRRMFGRPVESGVTPPASGADDLLRPVSSRLEREGGEALRRAEMFRHSQVDFLIDESHVRSLQSEGVPVAVSYSAARPRKQTPHRPAKSFQKGQPRNIQLVEEREQAIRTPNDPPPPPPRQRRPISDLRLFLPHTDIWCVPADWGARRRPLRRAEYAEVSAAWPATFHCLLEILAATIELSPSEFAQYVSRMEREMLNRKWPEKKARKEVRKRKRRRRLPSEEEESTTDESSVDMKLGSDSEPEVEEVEAKIQDQVHSPELFDQ